MTINSQSAVFYAYENVGLNPTASPDAVAYAYENVGLQQPTIHVLPQAQVAWGVRVKDGDEIQLLVDDSQAIFYAHVDVT